MVSKHNVVTPSEDGNQVMTSEDVIDRDLMYATVIR